MAQAVARSIAVNAAKGGQRAQCLFTELLSAAEREERCERDAALGAALDYKLTWERELERRKKLGISGPEPLPHPDDIVIDIPAGKVRVKGPATKEEKVAWARWDAYRLSLEEELSELKALRDDPDCPNRDEVLAEIEQSETALTMIRAALGSSRRAMQVLGGLDLPEENGGE
jgi:hypothetical protein